MASWYLPCICPIVSSLSSRSVPANNRSLAPRADRNFEDNEVNQEGQKDAVRERGVRQMRDCWAGVEGLVSCVGGGEGTRSGGTETRADAALRIVRLRMCQSMAAGKEGKEAG